MLETKTIGDLVAAGAVDGTELIEVEQAGASKKISADIPRLDDLDALVALVPATDQIRISQGADDHRRMTIADFLIAAGISSYYEAIDVSAGDYDQASTAKKQIYSLTTAAGSNDFNMLALANQEGCRVRVEKVDTGAGVGTVKPNGAETFLGGATGFPLRNQGDFIEYEVQGGVAIVIDSLSTLDSEVLTGADTKNTAHEIGVMPRIEITKLVCVDADANFAADDETTPLWGATSHEQTIAKDATNIIVNMLGLPRILNKTTHAAINCTTDKWKYRHRISI